MPQPPESAPGVPIVGPVEHIGRKPGEITPEQARQALYTGDPAALDVDAVRLAEAAGIKVDQNVAAQQRLRDAQARPSILRPKPLVGETAKEREDKELAEPDESIDEPANPMIDVLEVIATMGSQFTHAMDTLDAALYTPGARPEQVEKDELVQAEKGMMKSIYRTATVLLFAKTMCDTAGLDNGDYLAVRDRLLPKLLPPPGMGGRPMGAVPRK